MEWGDARFAVPKVDGRLIRSEELNFFAANYVFKVVPVVVKKKYAVNQKNESPAAKRPPCGESIYSR